MINLLVAVSGGRSSSLMARIIQTSKKYENYNKAYVFCNTGMERPETINFLIKMRDVWGLPIFAIQGVYNEIKGVGVRFKIIELEEIVCDTSIFELMIKHLNKIKYVGLPSSSQPYCSEYLKARVSNAFAVKYFGSTNYIKAIGYRAEDMPKRISFPEIKADNSRIFPLLTDFEKPINQNDLNKFFDKNEFKLELHGRYGNCRLCWKKSEMNLISTLRFDKGLVPWFERIEKDYNDVMFRERVSIKDLVKKSELPFTGNLFDEVEDGCVCSF